jgi:hypothetical protein
VAGLRTGAGEYVPMLLEEMELDGRDKRTVNVLARSAR